jgi:hypothetical protein
MSIHHKIIGTYFFNFPRLLGNCIILGLFVSSCAMGPKISKAEPPISLQEMEIRCRLPSPCGTPLRCHGEAVTFWGYVDPGNIISKQFAPRIPYEKFKIIDHGGRAIEVWAQAEDNRSIFEKLARRPTDRIVVSGKMVAFDMPITGQCNQGIKVIIHDASQIEFK